MRREVNFILLSCDECQRRRTGFIVPSDENILLYITTDLIPNIQLFVQTIRRLSNLNLNSEERVQQLLFVYQLFNQYIIEHNKIPIQEYELQIVNLVFPEFHLSHVRNYRYLYIRRNQLVYYS